MPVSAIPNLDFKKIIAHDGRDDNIEKPAR